MTDADAVLTANLDFYRAFNGSDIPAMEALWSRAAPVSCIHPGWTALHGREIVLQSWRDILANPEPTHVMCHDDQAFLHDDFAIVLCEEELAGAHLAVTNMFVREGGRWLMMHHQASPIFTRGYEHRVQRWRSAGR